jgi:hypothetical protein
MPEVQATVDRIAEWFVAEQKPQAALRTINEAVEIGIEVARKAHRGFAPQIQSDVERIAIRTIAVSEFADIFFTVLDNVYCHSGNRFSPWVKLRLWTEPLEPNLRIVKLRVENELAPGVVGEASINKLSRLRQLMRSGDYRRQVNLEGGTGLLKLQRLVSLDLRNALNFDFIGHEAFFVEIHLAMPFVDGSKDA